MLNSFSVVPVTVFTTRTCAGIAVLHEQHAVFSNGYGGVDFESGGRVIVPYHFLLWSYQRDAVLVCEEDVAVGKHNGIADFAFAVRIAVCPRYLPMADDKNSAAL